MPDGVLRAFIKHYKSLPMLVLMAGLLSLLVLLVAQSAVMQSLEDGSMDLRFRLSPQPSQADTNIVIVAIDDSSLRYVRQKLHQGWPWPREYYALITRFLDGEKAAATIFDLSFDEPDLDRAEVDSRLSDQEFAAALAQCPNTILGLTFTHYQTPPDSLVHPLPFAEGFKPKALYKWQGTLAPYPSFARHAKMGGINLIAGKGSTIRRVPLIYGYQDGYVPSLALQAFGKTEIQELVSRHAPDGTMYLNWHGAAGPGGVFRYIPFSQLLECALAEINGFEPPLPKGWFKDRYVFVGAVASGLQDLKSSPYTWGTPGMEVWATQLSNLLGHRFIIFLPYWGDVLVVFVLSLMMLGLVMRFEGISSSLAGLFIIRQSRLQAIARFEAIAASGAALILILVFCSISVVLFGWQRIALNLSTCMLALLITWLFGLTLSYNVEGRQKQMLRKMFSRYIHPDLVKEIVENPEQVHLGGASRTITILFTDIYDFTTITETYRDKSAILFRHLNRYFGTLAETILENYGLLDKYTGDGIMAVFGAPKENKDHALQACRAILAYRRHCASSAMGLEPELVQKFHHKTRVGIASGNAICGNVGSELRMDYTSIGDPVNLSARLEGINKIFGTHNILADSTYQLVKEQMLCRYLTRIKVKGKDTSIDIYELIEEQNMVDMADYAWLEDYAAALALYNNKDFEAAAPIFERLSQPPVNDQASKAMLKSCHYLIKHPPAKDWNALFTLE